MSSRPEVLSGGRERSSVIDITARARPEQALAKLAAIVESSEDAIISKDLDGIIDSWNRGAERLFGYTAEEAIGRPITILIPPEKVDEEAAILGRIRRGERIGHYETIRRRKDGTLLDVSLAVSPILDGDGNVIGASRIARDITERKRMEEALRDYARQFRETLDAMPAPVYATDAQGRLTYFNRAAAEVAGRAPQLGIDQWCMSWKMRHPDGRLVPHDECPMAVALKEGRPVRGVELVVERPDGTRTPCLPYPTPLYDAQGRVTGAVNMVLDLTDAKRADRAVARLAAIVETSADAIVSKDLNGIIESWNRGAEHLFGYTAKEAIGRPVTMLIPPERVDEEYTILDRIRRGERVEHYETVRRRKDGVLLDVSLSVSPIRDGDGTVIGASKIARDITERKRFEEALRWSEALLEAELADTRLLHRISSAMVSEGNTEALYEKIVDAAAAIMHSDFASMQMLYPERGKAGELRLLAFRGFNPQAAKHWEWVRADSECTCGIALRRGMRVIEPDVARPEIIAAGTADQETYLQTGIRAVQSTPLRSRSGELVGMISTHWWQPHRPSERDLSLLDILARQAADLIERKRAEDALRESDRRKDEFLAVLSHELRNPLAPMRHAVTLLQQAGDDEGIRRQASAILDRQLQHMTRLVEDLLDISRISHGQIDIRKHNVDLGAVILTATETSRPLVEAAGHRLDITLPGTPVKVFADRLRLAQVVSNLLNNAAKYTPSGGRIGVKVTRAPEEATISVRDNGIGISADELPRLFNMFTQLDSARRRTPAGLGVGLALSRQLVELHGGTLEAHSEGPDKGSEFIVRIPLRDDSPPGHRAD